MTDLDFTSLIAVHRAGDAEATLVLAKGYTLPVGIAEVNEDGLVRSFREKPTLDLSVTTGCMLVGPKAMMLMPRLASALNTDLMTHFVPKMLNMGLKVAPYYTEKEWYDMGTISNYEKLNVELNHRMGSYSRTFRPMEVPIAATAGKKSLG